jgi:hypothetical protein
VREGEAWIGRLDRRGETAEIDLVDRPMDQAMSLADAGPLGNMKVRTRLLRPPTNNHIIHGGYLP